ncbi:hypothetical protein ACU42Y_06255 [Proteus mirabilis]
MDTFSAKQDGSLGWITIGQELPELANASLTEKGKFHSQLKSATVMLFSVLMILNLRW